MLLLLLFMLPILPVALWVTRHQLPRTWGVYKWARSFLASVRKFSSPPAFVFSASVRKILSGPFVDRHWHWMAVLVLQRLLMVVVTVFIDIDASISLGMMIICH